MSRYSHYLDLIDEASKLDIGYNQLQRFSFLDLKNARLVNHSEADCSALTIGLAKLAGYPLDMSQPVWTGTAREKAAAIGWKVVPVHGLTAAQIQNLARFGGEWLVNEQHHIVCQTRRVGSWLSANMDEHGRATGGRAGDQTGNEVSVRPLWNYSHGGWGYLLIPNDVDGSVAAPAPTPAQDISHFLSTHDVQKLQSVIGTAADGVVGPLTIKALEKKAGMDQDGRLDTPSGTVTKVQRYLNQFVGKAAWCRYARLDEDGILGQATARALSAYLNVGRGAFTGLASVKL